MAVDGERLAHRGFRVAFAGGMLLLAALVVPEWRPYGFFPSPVQQLVVPATGRSGPTCVDRCGGGGINGLVVAAFVYVALLLVMAESQAFRREHLDTASGVAALGLLMGLVVLVPLAWGLASLAFSPGAAPDWGVFADSLRLVDVAGLLLVVAGNATAEIGLLRRPRSTWVDWDAFR